MTPEQVKAISQLRDDGYAVAIFTPEELDGADADRIEDLMVERGWNAIESSN